MSKEKILIEDFLEPLTKTRFFIEEETREYYAYCEWSNNFLSNEIVNKYGCFNDMIEGEDNFPYQLIDVSVEKVMVKMRKQQLQYSKEYLMVSSLHYLYTMLDL